LLTILFESIGDTNTNTFWTILFYHTHTHTYISPVYLSQQKKSKPSIFSLNHSGEITLLPVSQLQQFTV